MANPNLPTIPGYNTYVGARYVPVFYGAWLQSVSYEPLTIVEYQGNSYTSKTFVPANTPITDTTYWALTGNYNAQVEQYRQEVQAFDGRISYLETQEALKNRKYVFRGDSYNTTDTPAGGVPITPWSSFLPTMLGLTTADYYNSGYSGSGFVNGGEHTFLAQLQDIESSINDPSTITDIVVLGGINDGRQTGVGGAVTTFCEYATQHFTNANVHIGVISWVQGNNKQLFYTNILPSYQQASRRPRCNYINNMFRPMHCYLNWQPDGHPAAEASLGIAESLSNYLKTGEALTNYPPLEQTTLLTGTIALSNLNILSYYNNDDVVINFNHPSGGVNIEPQQFTVGKDVIIGNIPLGYYDSSSIVFNNKLMVVQFSTGTESFYGCGVFYITNGFLHVKTYPPESLGEAEISRLNFPALTIETNILYC